MTEKRQRKNNWTQLENQKLEQALQLFGRADIQKVVDYLKENLNDFHRSYKDVKKKIYNQLQEDIIHEISVKVRINLTYSVMMIMVQENKPIQPILDKLSKFCGHNVQRMEQNMKILEDHSNSLSLGMTCIRKMAVENNIYDITSLLLDNHFYKQLLQEFKAQLD